MNKSNSNLFAFIAMALVFLIGCRPEGSHTDASVEQQKPNVLFIAVDDLRPELSFYGKSQIISPNLDQLASQSLVFERAYCQVPVCGASRASLLTGLRPTRNRFLGYATRVSEDAPDALTLPQHFKDNGYHTISNSKIFHHRNDMAQSWSEAPWHPNRQGANWRNYVLEENINITKTNGNSRGPSYEIADVADSAYYDGMTALKTIDDLERLSQMNKPFFLAAGFLKPHLPFNAPEKYWNMYDEETIELATNDYRPENAPDAAMHNWGELRNYSDIPRAGRLTDEKARKLVHGYYACISYTDAQIGKVLDALDDLGLAKNTIVILWGDHGWNLREHSLWCKHANFETTLHAPLIVKVPGVEGGFRTSALTEFVDIYPSLCELASLSVPRHVEGQSFVPLLSDPDQPWKSHTVSKYYDGFSVKDDRYRYTEWSDSTGSVYARMLYDHENDPSENINIAENTENEQVISQMQTKLREVYAEDF